MARPKGSKNVKWDKEELRRLYWDERMHCKYIAKKYNTNSFAVREAMVRFGIPRRTKREMVKADLNYKWSGGRKQLTKGYIKVHKPNHPRADCGGYVLEHIIVWEEAHNKSLPEGWVIHHLNGIKDDNRLENLVSKRRGCHIHLAEPFKKRIKQLEIENQRLTQALNNKQLIFVN